MKLGEVTLHQVERRQNTVSGNPRWSFTTALGLLRTSEDTHIGQQDLKAHEGHTALLETDKMGQVISFECLCRG